MGMIFLFKWLNFSPSNVKDLAVPLFFFFLQGHIFRVLSGPETIILPLNTTNHNREYCSTQPWLIWRSRSTEGFLERGTGDGKRKLVHKKSQGWLELTVATRTEGVWASFGKCMDSGTRLLSSTTYQLHDLRPVLFNLHVPAFSHL